MATIGSLVVEIRATVDKFTADMKAAMKESEALEKNLQPLRETTFAVGTAMTATGAAVLTAIGAMTVHTADLADHMNDLTQKTGVSVETLTAYRLAANASGTTIDGLAGGLGKLAKNMEAAEAGGKSQQKAFEDLGITAAELTNAHGDVNKIMLMVADRFKEMPDGAEKTADAMKIFGKSGADLIPMLNQGSAGLEEMRKQAERAGVVFGEKLAKAGDEFNDKWGLVAASLEGISIAIGQVFIPLGIQLADILAPIIQSITAWIRAHTSLVEGIAALALAILGGGGLMLAISAIIAAIPLVTAGFAALGIAGGPIFLVIAAIVAIGAAIFLFRDQILDVFRSEQFQVIVEAFRPALTELEALFNTILSAITEFWAKWGDDIMAIVRLLLEAVWPMIRSSLELIGHTIENTLHLIGGAVDVFASLFTGDWHRFAHGLSTIWEAIWSEIDDILHAYLGTVWDTAKDFAISFMTAWTLFAEFIWAKWQNVWALVQNFLVEPFNAIRTVLSDFVSWFGDLWRGVWNWAYTALIGEDGWLTKIGNYFGGWKTWILDEVQALSDGFFDVWTGLGNWIYDWWVEIWSSISLPDWFWEFLDALGITVGEGLAFFGLGSPAPLASGTNYVPEDMFAIVHRGEAVVPAEFNPANPAAGGATYNNGGNTIVINFSGSADELLSKIRNDEFFRSNFNFALAAGNQ